MGAACSFDNRDDEPRPSEQPRRPPTTADISASHYIGALFKPTPTPGTMAITLGGFPDDICGEDRSFLNGSYEPRMEKEFEVHHRETYWSCDGMWFIFLTAQGKWMLNSSSAFQCIKGGEARGYASTTVGAEILDPKYASFGRIFDGARWNDISSAGVVSHTPMAKPKMITPIGSEDEEMRAGQGI